MDEPLLDNKLPVEQLKRRIREISAEQLQTHCGKLSPANIKAIVAFLTEKFDAEWKEKIQALVLGLIDCEQLEVVGKSLNLAQAMELLRMSSLETVPQLQSKLSPIFVGMPHPLFRQILTVAPSKEFIVLKREGITEPMQHHLTLLIHEMTTQLTDCDSALTNLEREIEGLQIAEMGRADIAAVKQKIAGTAECYQAMLDLANQALAVAWNTNRPDLIEKLSTLKDNWQKSLHYRVGTPVAESSRPTGFYAILEKRLHAVYGNSDDPNDIEALKDDEPAIEALAKFSVWYLQDYLEIGLLPKIESADLLDMDPAIYTERERQEYREQLFMQAESNLEKIGLKTLKDLKEAQIFSKKALLEYIREHYPEISSRSPV
jgi:hypothetical protein